MIKSISLRAAFTAISVLILISVCLAEEVYRKITHNTDPEAKCLDGTPGLLYIHQGTQKDKFLLFFVGGGLCGQPTLSSTLQSCYKRSKTQLGSSKYWPDILPDGIVGGYVALNEHLYQNWTKILFGYCDGSFHQGHSDSPVSYKDAKLYFRGADIVRSHFKWLIKEHQMDKASKIMLTGSSAGGVAAYLWSNYLQSIIANPQAVYTVPDSGVAINAAVYDTKQKRFEASAINLFKLSNINQKTPNPECDANYPGEQYKCLFIENNHSYLKGKYLFINSQYDQWVLDNIIRTRCLKNGASGKTLKSCSQEQMKAIEQYREKYLALLDKIRTKDRGVWTIGCSNHVYAPFDDFYDVDAQRIPQKTGITVKDAIKEFIIDEKIGVWTVDQQKWPGNAPCAY